MAGLTYGVLIGASLLFAGLSGFLLLKGLYLTQSRHAEAVKAMGELSETDSPLRRAILNRFAGWSARFLKQQRQEELKKRFLMMGAPQLRPVDFITYQQLSCVFFPAAWPMVPNFLRYLWLSPIFGAFGRSCPTCGSTTASRSATRPSGASCPTLDLLTSSRSRPASTSPPRCRPSCSAAGKGALHEELSIMLNEIRMGKTREESPRNRHAVGFGPLSQFVANPRARPTAWAPRSARCCASSPPRCASIARTAPRSSPARRPSSSCSP
ncbi:MAG: hypothetical protein U0838_17830 [Chloroflexota bacterium]